MKYDLGKYIHNYIASVVSENEGLKSKVIFLEDQQTQNDVYVETLLMEIDRLKNNIA